MKNAFCLAAVFLFIIIKSDCQQLSQVTFSQASTFSWFTVKTTQNVLVRISDVGKILEYGTEEAALNNRNYFAPKLIPYNGVITLYQNDPDSSLNGKIKNIGACYFTYYSSKDYPERAGKIRMAGNLLFDYYRQYNDPLTGGKLKSIGQNTIAWYTSFDNEILKGKLKTIGTTSIDYYSLYDNQSLKGKIKNIGSYRLDWATTFSGRELVNYLKSGNQRMLINGIAYILQ